MKAFYLFLARHQKIVKKIFFLGYVAMVLAFIGGVWAYGQMPETRSSFNDLGRKFGQISTLLLVLSMTPGILGRLNILRMVESTLLIFRRQFGITAFFTAMLHLGYISWIRRIATGQNPLPSYFTYQETGFAALSIFILLWFISNDFSMRLFGPVWKMMQRLAYIAAIALLVHIFEAQSSWWYLVGAYLTLEVISWSVVLFKKIFPTKKPTSMK